MIDPKLVATAIIATALVETIDHAPQQPEGLDGRETWTRRPVKVKIRIRPAPAKIRGQALTGPGRGRRR